MNQKQEQERFEDQMPQRHRRLQHRVPLPFPMVLNLELTNACTENCIWCPRDSMTRATGFMKPELFRKIIDEASHHEPLRKLFVHWMGEPLLHPRSVELLEYAKRKNVADMILVATNGYPLTVEIMRGLIRIGVDELYISIDAASPERYRALKNTGHYAQIEQNIRAAMALRSQLGAELPFVRVKLLETDQNVDEADEFSRKWQGIADDVFFEKDLSIWDGTSEKVNQNVKGMNSYLRNYGTLNTRYPCDRLWYLLAVQWDGKVSPCVCDWNGENVVGDLNTQTISEIWYGEMLRTMRQQQINEEYGKIKLCGPCDRWGTRNMGDWLLKHKAQALSLPKVAAAATGLQEDN